MNKKLVGGIAAAVMAIVGTAVLVLFVQGAEDRALEGENLVEVLTASETIPPGTPVADIQGRVKTERIPSKIAPDGVISDLVSVSGLVTRDELVAGEALISRRFVEQGDFSARRGPVSVPEGHLEVTVAMSQEQFVGGVPVPGDRVAVVALGDRVDFIPSVGDPLAQAGATPGPEGGMNPSDLNVSKIILQQALVTHVQGNALPEPAAQTATERVAPAEGAVLVTLALEGPDVERLIYVRAGQTLNANLHMALHADETEVASEGISVENIISPGASIG